MIREQKAYVFIYLPGETISVPAGIFTHFPDNGVGRFVYGRRYLKRKDAQPVDIVALPLGERSYEVTSNGGMFGAFRDASPDYWGRLVIATESKSPPETLTEVEYLLRSNASRVGCLDFRTSSETGEPQFSPPTFQNLGDLLKAARRLDEHKPVARDLLQLLEQGSSIGGARPKCTLEFENALWIAKFPARNDSVDFPKIEYATMSLAGKCGINIPPLKLLAIGSRSVMLVKRFDREKSEGGYLRSGFVSALSLMEWDERDRDLWSYTALADQMRATILAQPDDLVQLFRRMVFNVLCRNTDDHPRNHGFLRGGSGWALSPAYDITPTLARSGVTTDFSLSLSLGSRGREATIVNALSKHSSFGLTPAAANLIVTEMQATVAAWEEHFKTCGVDSVDMEALRASFGSE